MTDDVSRSGRELDPDAAAEEPNAGDMEIVYTANGEMEAHTLKSVLEAAGIPVELKVEAATKLFAVTVDGLGAVKILVPEDRLEEAKALLETPAQPIEDEN